MKKCVFCGAEFEFNEDFQKHMDTFGWDYEKHLWKLEELHNRKWEKPE